MTNILTAESIILIMIIGSIIYLVFATWQLRASENIRVELVKLHNELIERADIEESHKKFLSFMLNVVFSWRFVAKMTWLIVIVPIHSHKTDLNDSSEKFFSDDQVRYFCNLHLKAALAANPMWGMLYKIVLKLKVLAFIARIKTSRYDSDSVKYSKFDVGTKYGLFWGLLSQLKF